LDWTLRVYQGSTGKTVGQTQSSQSATRCSFHSVKTCQEAKDECCWKGGDYCGGQGEMGEGQGCEEVRIDFELGKRVQFLDWDCAFLRRGEMKKRR